MAKEHRTHINHTEIPGPAFHIQKVNSEEIPDSVIRPRKHTWIPITILCVLLVAAGLFAAVPLLTKEDCQISMYAEINGHPMEDGGTYTVRAGDVITVEASSQEALIERIGYCWGYGKDVDITDEYDNRISIVVPPQDAGYKELLRVEAIASNDDGSANTVTKTGWYKYNLEYVSQVSMDVSMDGMPLNDNGSYKVSGGETITVSAESCAANIAFIAYYFTYSDQDNEHAFENRTKIYDNHFTIAVPDMESDQAINLFVEAVAENDTGDASTVTKTGWMKYTFAPKK